MDSRNDLSLLYAGWPAETVLWLPRSGQGDTGRAILNQPGAVVFDGEAQMTDASLQYPTSSFPTVRQGDRFVINGVTWSASAAALASQDGEESVVAIVRAGG